MGTAAGLYLAAAGQSIEHIAALVAIANLARPAEDQLALDDVLPATEREPRLAFVPQPDGTVLLTAPTEGIDDWGKPIPTEPPTFPGMPLP
jgi:hypothetical protein